MRLMTLGSVLMQRGGGVGDKAAGVRCHPHPAMEDFHRGGRVAGIQLLAHELVRHAVIVPLDFDVIIDVGLDGFPFRDDVAFGRQRFKRRPVQLFEQKGTAGIRTLAEGAVVQPIEQFANGFVKVSQLEELPMPQRGYDPALCDLNAGSNGALHCTACMRIATNGRRASVQRPHSG